MNMDDARVAMVHLVIEAATAVGLVARCYLSVNLHRWSVYLVPVEGPVGRATFQFWPEHMFRDTTLKLVKAKIGRVLFTMPRRRFERMELDKKSPSYKYRQLAYGDVA
mgnify:CR=1 FL=1